MHDDQAALVILQEMGKASRTNRIRLEREANAAKVSFTSSEDVPATEKQIGFLTRLGVKVPEGLSKREASALLDQELTVEAA